MSKLVLYLVATLACLCAAAADSFAAPPQCDRFFPAGVQRGSETTVTAEGKFDAWPVKAWTSTSALVIEAAEKKGQLLVKPGSDVACGIHWVRLYTPDGASALRPIVVSGGKEQLEVEPNESLDKAQETASPVTINGRLGKRGDVDVFAIRLEAGERLVAALDANMRFGSPMDGVLQIVSAAGFVIDQNDDSRGIDPLLVFVAPKASVYYVRVFGFPETPNQTIGFGGGDEFIYRLVMTTRGYLDHTLPLAVTSEQGAQLQLFGWNLADGEWKPTVSPAGNQFAQVYHDSLSSSALVRYLAHGDVAGSNIAVTSQSNADAPCEVTLPVVASGRISAANGANAFSFQAKAGQAIAATVEAEALGSRLDPHLTLLDANGKTLAEVDDTGRKRDCVLRHQFKQDGTVRLMIRDAHRHGGFRYFYRMSVEEAQPDFSLTLSADAFVMEPDKPLEITVAVARRNGFAAPVEISLLDAPGSVDIPPVTSKPDGESAKKVTLKLSSSGVPFAGIVRICGRAKQETAIERFATASIKPAGMTTERIWLTVVGR